LKSGAIPLLEKVGKFPTVVMFLSFLGFHWDEVSSIKQVSYADLCRKLEFPAAPFDLQR
jgi:hypothetical protein